LLYEFAIIPDVFERALIDADPSLNVTLVELLRGICDSGLIANLHREAWGRHIRTELVDNLPPALRDKVIVCLNILNNRHRIVRHRRSPNGDPTTNADWLAIARDSNQRIPFYGVVLSEPLLAASGGGPGFLGISTVLDSASWRSRRRSLTIPKTITEYRRVLGPILRHAKALSLVDPYITAHRATYTDVIDLCSDLMGNRAHDRLPGRIHIHADINKQDPGGYDPPYYANQWMGALTPLVHRYGHHFRVILWRGTATKSLHDRFMLTDQCGISSTAGLDVRARSTQTTTLSLLDEEDRRANLDDYDATVSPFQLVPPFPLDVP
jgi:hypothetical protein